MNKLDYYYDAHSDVLIINNVKYSGELFRAIATNKPSSLTIDKDIKGSYVIKDDSDVEVMRTRKKAK